MSPLNTICDPSILPVGPEEQVRLALKLSKWLDEGKRKVEESLAAGDADKAR